MNVYDFDETIYDGDSTVDFYKYCVKRKPSLLLLLPKQGIAFMKYMLGMTRKEEFKETVYLILTKIDDLNSWINDFWDKNIHKIKEFYKAQKREDDLVISASPEFIIKNACGRLGIASMASRIDPKTGKHMDGINCHGKRKVERFYEVYPEGKIEQFYSDSYSDTPLAELAEEAFLVKKDVIYPWNEYTPSTLSKIKSMFFDRSFLLFLIVGVINTFNGVVFAFLYSLFIKNANLAFIVGYVTSLTISYLLNSKISFKEELSFPKYIKFCISYIPNFLIQNAVVIVVYNMMNWPKLIAYLLAAVIGIPITYLFIKVFAFKRVD